MLSGNDKMRRLFIYRCHADRRCMPDLFAAEGESEGGANFLHSFVAQPGETRPELILRNNGDVVKVDHAWPLHSVFHVKKDFG